MRYWTILFILVLTSCSLGTGGDPSEHEWCTVTPAGGTFEFSNGMTLIVPPGAVSEDTPLYLEDMSQSDLEAFLAVRGLQAEDLAFAFHVGPGDLAFSEPVTVRIPVNTLAAGDLPFVQVHDLDNGSFAAAEVSYLFDSVENVIELTTDHFSGYSCEAVEDMDIKNDLGSEAPCRSGRIRVETRDSANSCLSGDCQMLSSTVAVQFLDCPDTPTEEVTIEEITPGCRPRLHLDPEAEHIPPGTRSPMTTRLMLGCREMPTQTVNFEITGVPAAMDPNSATTDEDGLVHTDIVVGDEEGLITVTAQTEIIYSTMKVIFNGEVIQEEQKTENVTESVDLYVFQDPEMSLSVSPDLVAPGDSAAVNVEIHRNDVPVENATVNMQVVGPVTLAASSGTTDTDGALTVGVTAGDSQGTATVTADSLVITELDDGNTISTALLAQADVTVLATGIGLYAMRDAFYLNHDEPVSAYVFSDGALLEDAVVEFSANNGNTVTPTTATADQWGHYNTTFQSSTEGAATVTARTTLNGTTYSNTLDLTVLDSSPQDYIGRIIGRVAKTATSSYIPSYEIDVQVDLAFTVDPSIDCSSNMVELDNIAGAADLSILSVTMHDGYPTADNPNYWIYEDFQVRSVAGITITGDATGYPDDPYSPPQMYLNFSIDSPPAFIQYTPVHMEYYEDSGYSRSEHDPEEIAFRSVDYSNQLDPQWDMLEWDTVGDADLSYLRIRTDDVVLQTDDYGSISIERVD